MMKNKIKYLGIIFFLFFVTSCTKDWLDINDNPNLATTPELNQLLSGSEYFMVQGLGQGNFLGNGLSSYVHQLVSKEIQNYGMQTTDNNTLNSWNYLCLYGLADFEAIIEYAEPDGNMIYAGVAKTLKAYAFSMMVDVWGDVPYSEFNIPGLFAPKPDNSAVIYNSLIALLEEAKGDLSDKTAANVLKPGDDDFFYGGDVDKWIRLNNTIKLKLLLQSRNAKSDITNWEQKKTDLIAENKFINKGEDFQFWFTKKETPEERHPAYVSEYVNTGSTYNISPFFYETMKGLTYNTTKNPFAGIVDPRLPYYFVNQLKDGETPANRYPYREGNFLSMFFADNGGNSSNDQARTMTKIGLYPCGGKYDNGSGGAVNKNVGNGEAPLKLITYHSLKFMLAELVLSGNTTGDAKTYMKDGIEAAIAHVNTVAAKQTTVPRIVDADRDRYVNAILALYDAASAEKKLEIVMTQKWIGNFFSPIDIYTDYRRTGYPIFFNPQNTEAPGFGVNPTVTETSPRQVPLLTFASYPRSLYYPAVSEVVLNPNMSQKTNLATKFIFWDK